MSATCGTCRLASVAVGEDNEPRLDCHRYPPAVTADEQGLAVVFPQVDADDWCGEHDPDGPT